MLAWWGLHAQSVAHSSASSFNPPEPLALMSVKPLGRVSETCRAAPAARP